MSSIPDEILIGLYLTYFVSLMALICDYKFKKISPLLTWPVLAFGIGTSIALGGWNDTGNSLANFLNGQGGLCLYQTSINLGCVIILFGPATLKGALSSGDFYLLLSLASLNYLGPFLTLLVFIAILGCVIALIVLIKKRQLTQAFKAVASRLMLKGRLRDEKGYVDPIHKLTISYSPAVALGVLLSGAGWGWS